MAQEGMPPDNNGEGPTDDPVYDALAEVSRTMGSEPPLGSEDPPLINNENDPEEAGTAASPEIADPLTQAHTAVGGDQLEADMDRAMDLNLRIEMLPPALRASMIALRSQPYVPGGLERYVRTAENAAAILRAYPTPEAINTLRSANENEKDRRAALERLEQAGYVPAIGISLSQACDLALWTFE